MPATKIEIPNIETYSDSYVQEMIGAPPGWIVRSGISLIGLFVIVTLGLAALIRYPDKITAPTVLRTEHPPTEIVAQTSGYLDTILIQNGDKVAAQTLLAVITDAASPKEVTRLELFLQKCQLIITPTDYVKIQAPALSRLGNLGNGYATLLQTLKDLQYVLQQTGTTEQLAAAEREIARTRQLNQSYRKQEILLADELKIVQKDLERNRQLHASGTISAIDLEEKEKIAIQYRRQLESMPASALQNDIRIEQLQAQQTQLRHQREADLSTRTHALRQQVQSLQAAITTWQQTFLIQSSNAGTVAFAPDIAAKKPIQVGATLFTILPDIPHPLTPEGGRVRGQGQIAISKVATTGLGKVTKGSRVQIALDAYPAREYGVLNAQITAISLLPTTDKEGKYTYEVTIALPDTLVTSYRQTLPFQQNSTGVTTIITEDKSILERIFENFLDLAKNK